MPTFNTKPEKYKKSKEIKSEWTNFRKGLNQLSRPTELENDELAVAQNVILTGSGVPTGRWGTGVYFTANATGTVRGFGTYKSNDGATNEIFTLTDEGYLAKKNGSSFTVMSGQSYPSGSIIRTEQLGGETYIVSENVTFTKYDGTNLSIFATISPPTGLSATNFSGATGPDQVSYKVVAVGENGGTTTPSDPYVLVDLPNTLSNTSVHLFWTAPSAATLSGYEIYRGILGDETLLASVGPDSTKYVDTGEPASLLVEPPLTNTTGGVKSKFIKKYKSRMLLIDKDDPNKLLISAIYPDHTKFSALDGGGSVYVDPDSGDNITGIEVQPIADRIVVYKNYSSYLVELQQIQAGNYYFLDPQYAPISTAVGCSNQDTIATVENDTFYFGRSGIYVTGYEPNFLNIIRTNEVSAKIRPYLELLNDDDYNTACAMYVDNKYILSFPLRKEMIVYDRERGAFTGPFKLPYGISHMRKYIDGSGTEQWVLGSYENNIVYKFDSGLNTDNGTAISKSLRTGKVSVSGDWTVLGIAQFFYVLFRAIIGTITVNILVEDRSGTTTTVKTFTISGSEVAGSTGYGMDQYGLFKYGIPNSTSATTTTDEITRWGSLFKQARLLQVEVLASSANSNFELLKIMVTSSSQSRGSLSSSQRV